jgi:adenine-specific DNA-methyltransferase
MAKQLQKLELTWIGKGNEPKLEPRILIEDTDKSYWQNKENGAPPPWKNQNFANQNHSPSFNQENHSSDNCNMLIHGDNLLALKALEQNYTGKIKCIYIDPPYNTGNAFEHYDDGIEHSLWLSLMKPRLDILKNLLHEEGSLWITLDENEIHYMKVMCDEIFGRKNFIISVIWNSRKSKQNDTLISLAHNHILVYSKNIDKVIINRLPIKDDKFSNPDNDPKGDWVADPMDAPNIRTNLEYEIVNPITNEIFLPPKGRHWRFTKEKYEEALKNGMIIFGKSGKSKPQLKRYKSDAAIKGEASNTWWDDCGTATEATQELIKLFTKDNLFATPKPERLLQKVLTLGSNKNDIVLDSFLGSGTTAAVAHKLNRKWIGIELGEHANTHCLPRLKQVVSGTDKGGISEAVNWQGGGGFKFYNLAPSLIQKDKYGNDIINTSYNANMLAAAMAKQEGFHYAPHESIYWKQGNSTEKDYIFTTTQFITVELIDRLAEEMQPNESLLICCKGYSAGCKSRHANITIKKIPQMLFGRCEFGKDDYSLNIVNLPHDENSLNYDESDEMNTMMEENKSKEKKKKGKADDDSQPSLF